MLMHDPYESVLLFLHHINASEEEIKNAEVQMSAYGEMTVDEYLAIPPVFY